MGNYYTLKRVSSYNYRRLYQPPENNFETYFGEGGGGVRKVDWVYSYSLQRYNLYNLPRDFSLTLPCHGQADVVFIGSFGGRKWRQMAPCWAFERIYGTGKIDGQAGLWGLPGCYLV